MWRVALGVVVLGALWGLVGAAFITARPADPMLWPARAGAPTVDIAVTFVFVRTSLKFFCAYLITGRTRSASAPARMESSASTTVTFTLGSVPMRSGKS